MSMDEWISTTELAQLLGVTTEKFERLAAELGEQLSNLPDSESEYGVEGFHIYEDNMYRVIKLLLSERFGSDRKTPGDIIPAAGPWQTGTPPKDGRTYLLLLDGCVIPAYYFRLGTISHVGNTKITTEYWEDLHRNPVVWSVRNAPLWAEINLPEGI